ncbi:MAG: TonB-dependent receptor plug domain-containing protein, partial [Bryobacteraceae bacterium]
SFRRYEEPGLNSRIYWGVETFSDAISSTNLGAHSRSRAAALAAWDARALRRYSLSLGVRVETYRPGRAPVSPSLAGGAWLSPRLKWRAAVARAFRVPSFTDLYYRDPVTRGSPDLRPESAWSAESGIHAYFERIEAALTLFQRTERDGIDYVRRPGEAVWQAVNLRRLRMRGLEWELRARPRSGDTLELACTLLEGVRKTLGDVQTRYAVDYPALSTVAQWQGTLGPGLLVRTRAGAWSRRGRPAYAVWDGMLARDGARLQPFLHAYNLTSTRYEEIAGVPMPGRTIVAGVTLRLRRSPR